MEPWLPVSYLGRCSTTEHHRLGKADFIIQSSRHQEGVLQMHWKAGSRAQCHSRGACILPPLSLETGIAEIERGKEDLSLRWTQRDIFWVPSVAGSAELSRVFAVVSEFQPANLILDWSVASQLLCITNHTVVTNIIIRGESRYIRLTFRKSYRRLRTAY